MCLRLHGHALARTHIHTDTHTHMLLLLLVGCLTSQQHASVSEGRICSDNFTCCHTEIEVADQTFRLTQSQYTDTGPTSPSTDPIMPGTCRVAAGVPIFKSLVWLDPEKIPGQAGFKPGIFCSRGGRLTTRPMRRLHSHTHTHAQVGIYYCPGRLYALSYIWRTLLCVRNDGILPALLRWH